MKVCLSFRNKFKNDYKKDRSFYNPVSMKMCIAAGRMLTYAEMVEVVQTLFVLFSMRVLSLRYNTSSEVMFSKLKPISAVSER